MGCSFIPPDPFEGCGSFNRAGFNCRSEIIITDEEFNCAEHNLTEEEILKKRFRLMSKKTLLKALNVYLEIEAYEKCALIRDVAIERKIDLFK